MRPYLRFNRIRYQTPDNQRGASDSSQQNNDGQNNQNAQQGGNNNQNNVDPFATIWQTESAEAGEHSQNDQQNQNNQQSQNRNDQNTQQPGDFFNNYLKDLNFLEGINTQEIAQKLTEGDAESLGNTLNSIGRAAYGKAIVDANKIIEARVAKAVDEAVAKSSAHMSTDMAMRTMQERLPFTKQPAIQPVAATIMAQLMRKGDDVDKAIANTGEFFKHIYKLSAKDLGLNKPPRATPGSGNQRNIVEELDDAESGEDWLKVLTDG